MRLESLKLNCNLSGFDSETTSCCWSSQPLEKSIVSVVFMQFEVLISFQFDLFLVIFIHLIYIFPRFYGTGCIKAILNS